MSHPAEPGAATSSTGPASTAPVSLTAWRNAVFVILTLSGLTIATWVARIPAVRDQLSLDTAAIGVLIFGLAGGSVVGLVAAPHILGRLGPRGGIVLSMCLNGLGLIGIGVATSFIPSPVIAIISLAVLGFGNGSLDVMMNVEGAAAERAIKRTLLPLMHAFFSLGTVIGAGIGALASALSITVLVNLAVMGAVIAAGGIVAVRYLPTEVVPEVVPEESGASGAAATGATTEGSGSVVAGGQAAAVGSAVGGAVDGAAGTALPVSKPTLAGRIREAASIWRDRSLLLIGLVILGMAFAEGSANDWLALASVDGHDQTNTVGAIVFGIFVTAMTVGRVVGGPLLDRFGRVLILRLSAVVGAVGLLMFILSPVFAIAVVGVVLWGLGASLGFPVGISAASDDSRNAAARVSAVAIIGYLAFLAGPPLIGFLGQQFGLLNALYVVLALLVLAAFASPAARERTGRFARPSLDD